MGAEFAVFLKSSGSYDGAKESERDYLTCDENGYAETKLLPYGVYTVRQTKGWDGRELMKDFDVFINKDGGVFRYLINNAPFTSYVKVIKTDAETGKAIPYAGAGFQIYDPNGQLVTMQFTYPAVTTIPFLDFRCALDSDNLIIYGHNMMNGTMFARLQGYVQKEFCEQHPIIEFQTADGCAVYQVFSVAWVKSNDEWYKTVNLDSAEDFNSAVEKITGEALFTINSAPKYGRQILTLSTCYDSANNGRLLVLAAKI